MEKYSKEEMEMLKEMGFSFEHSTQGIMKKEFQTTKFRRICRQEMIKHLKILCKCQTKKQFDTFYKKYSEDYKKWYVSQDPTKDFVFDSLRKDENREFVINAFEVIKKFAK